MFNVQHSTAGKLRQLDDCGGCPGRSNLVVCYPGPPAGFVSEQLRNVTVANPFCNTCISIIGFFVVLLCPSIFGIVERSLHSTRLVENVLSLRSWPRQKHK